MGARPAYMDLLELKGIRARGYFRVRGEAGAPARCYAVTPACRVVTPLEEPVALTENDVWEWFERIERIGREEFLAARDAAWAARGRPTRRQLAALADRFAAAYARGGWADLPDWDEETIRRIIGAALGRLPAAADETPRRRAERIYREAARAKAMRGKGQSKKDPV